MKEKNVPVLRFKEFERNWLKKRLSDIIELISGQHLNPNQYTKIRSETPYFTGPSDFTNKIGNLNKWTSFNSKVAKKYDVLLTVKGSGVGNMMYLTLERVAMGRQLMALRTNRDSSSFLFYFLHKKTKHFEKLSLGNMIPGISRQDILHTKIEIPSLPEQQKIANFLSAVDQKIQQLQEKKALLKQYKKGVLQQIFSQQIRFKQADGSDFPDWELFKAKDLFKNHSNKNHDGELPILAATQDRGVVLRDSIGIKIQSTTSSVKSYKIVEKGDFVISLRSFQGGIEYSDLKGICSPAYTILKPKLSIVDQFFKYYFKRRILLPD